MGGQEIYCFFRTPTKPAVFFSITVFSTKPCTMRFSIIWLIKILWDNKGLIFVMIYLLNYVKKIKKLLSELCTSFERKKGATHTESIKREKYCVFSMRCFFRPKKCTHCYNSLADFAVQYCIWLITQMQSPM